MYASIVLTSILIDNWRLLSVDGRFIQVAETMLNPFGEDDDDFEINVLIDRHIQVNASLCSASYVRWQRGTAHIRTPLLPQ